MSKEVIRFAVLTAIAVMFLGGTLLRGQNMRTADRGRGNITAMGDVLKQVNENPYGAEVEYDENGNPIETQQKDSTKKVKIKKALESYFFSDSLRAAENFEWNIDTKTNNIYVGVLDTLIEDFDKDYIFLRNDVGDAYVGNLGGVSIPLNFFRRSEGNDFSFTAPYYAYTFTPENVPFFNVKSPYTRLGYISAGQKKFIEENFTVLHAQNISPSSGFNINYQNQGARGIYSWQRSKVKNLSLGFSHTGKRYSIHAGYIYNMTYQRENGGVVDDWHVVDTVYENSLNVPMKMKDAVNEMKNNTFFAVQSLGVPLVKLSDDDFSMAGRPSFYVGHAFIFNRWKKHYTDTYEGTTYDIIDQSTNEITGSKNYYDNWYVNGTQTRDTLAESVMSNRLFIQLQPWGRNSIVGVVDGGIGMDNHTYYQFSLDQYLSGSKKVRKESYYLYGSIEGRFKKYFDWSGNVNYTLAGYRSGDLNFGADAALSAYIKGSPITLSGEFTYRNERPSYWSENYFSNHFVWSNSFAKENETRVEVKLQAPHYKAEAGIYQSVLGKKVYYDANSLPTQASDAVSVTGVYFRKDFTLGNIHLNNRVMMQWSSDQQVVPVPLAAVHLSYFYQVEAVKNVLTLKLGLDGWYNSKYYAFAYNPAIMQFYNQREKEIGEYPMVDAFVTAKWKRVRLIVKYQHAGENMVGSREYFNVLHYPLNRSVLKFGLSWSFYD